MAVIPTAKALYLCEEVGVEGGLTNLYGLFDGLRPRAYPYTPSSFVCFAQLRGGLGDVRRHIDIRRANDSRVIHTTNQITVAFPDRVTQRQFAVTIEGCVLELPGLYLAELFCDNTWVADTTLVLREVGP